MIPQTTPPPDGLKAALAGLPVPRLLYYASVGSTNDVALEWAKEGAADWSLVVADEQTKGRGRSDRRWFTPPRSALAFSVVVRPTKAECGVMGRFAAWGALGVASALEALGLKPRIKWPNDVLLGGEKVSGVLAEAVWSGDVPTALVVGIGVNVLDSARPPRELTDFPAGSVEAHLGVKPARWHLLRRILTAMAEWRARLPTDEFLRAWEARLAYRGAQVQLGEARGVLLGLSRDGGIVLRTPSGERLILHAVADAHLRPIHQFSQNP